MKHLLIVDDQPGIRLLLEEIFKPTGIMIALASNGKEALEIVRKQNPDCVLLDMKMPGMNGVEVLREIRTISPEAIVMMMTAYSEIELLNDADKLGIDQHFTKPFDIFEVRDSVLRRLELLDV
ncbi:MULTISPECIES: response regulator [unclassified Sporosarcina]|uniref:response regulator n=1 Tax=unclassified Sporosarcina TaxID=2647733 RepID=UPI000C16CC91|nr:MULTISPECIES: response regulator [unclassified Sporosarcina]PIC98164.1 two-component system response regulator [Sporosarcina sp. P29]PID05285.1 two-component system response regulator [Sporosarcina sp. P30]PID08403.1 two-component system response regulator [Sporosarcina sp. P31]PID12268.1 two-component system response regulator [Sporosarcina sp. P32b]